MRAIPKNPRTWYLLKLGHAGVPASAAARRLGTSRAWASYVYARAGIAAVARMIEIRPCWYCGKPLRAIRSCYCNATCRRNYRKGVTADGSRPCRGCGETLPADAFYAERYTRCIACHRKANLASKAKATQRRLAAERAYLVELLAADETGLRDRLAAQLETLLTPDCPAAH